MTNKTPETAGQKLKRTRLKNKISIDDISISVGISYDEYLSYEHETKVCSDRKMIDKLASALGCRDSDILKG